MYANMESHIVMIKYTKTDSLQTCYGIYIGVLGQISIAWSHCLDQSIHIYIYISKSHQIIGFSTIYNRKEIRHKDF